MGDIAGLVGGRGIAVRTAPVNCTVLAPPATPVPDSANCRTNWPPPVCSITNVLPL